MKQKPDIWGSVLVGCFYGGCLLALVIGLQASKFLSESTILVMESRDALAETQATLIPKLQAATERLDLAAESTNALIGEVHSTFQIVRKSADIQRGYYEATATRSADIAQKTQLAVKHLDEAILDAQKTMECARAGLWRVSFGCKDKK